MATHTHSSTAWAASSGCLRLWQRGVLARLILNRRRGRRRRSPHPIVDLEVVVAEQVDELHHHLF
ncbi:MAG: hypothetical protein VX975_01200, partial [Acidobacteriota bacterium]|nr:hypothetical protein [Acidobacteriota bacterium]